MARFARRDSKSHQGLNFQLPPLSLHLDESVSAAPDCSPGTVQDDERLLRALFNPQHVQQGKVLARAIPVKDLRERGFSVHRVSHVTPDFVQSYIDDALFRPRSGEPWTDEGVAILLTAKIRKLLLNGQRAFVVIDTGHPDNPGHASIYAAQPDRSEAHARELRTLLLPLLQNRLSVQEAFSR